MLEGAQVRGWIEALPAHSKILMKKVRKKDMEVNPAANS